MLSTREIAKRLAVVLRSDVDLPISIDHTCRGYGWLSTTRRAVSAQTAAIEVNIAAT
jgi:hypothetical protein